MKSYVVPYKKHDGSVAAKRVTANSYDEARSIVLTAMASKPEFWFVIRSPIFVQDSQVSDL